MKSLLKGNSLVDTSSWVLSLEFFKLNWGILVKELVEGQESTTNDNLNLVLDALHANTLGTKLVDTLRLAHKHDLELLAVWVVVDVLSKLLVDRVVLDWNVDSNTRLQVNNVLTQSLDFSFVSLQLFKHFKVVLLRLVEFSLKTRNVLNGSIKMRLKFSLGCLHLIVMHLPSGKLLLNIFLLLEKRLEFCNGALKLNSHLLVLVQRNVKLVDFSLILGSSLLHNRVKSLDLSVFLNAERLHLSSKFLNVDSILLVSLTHDSLVFHFLAVIDFLLLSNFSEESSFHGGHVSMKFLQLSLEVVFLRLELVSVTGLLVIQALAVLVSLLLESALVLLSHIAQVVVEL